MPLDADDIAEIINLGHEYNQAVDRHGPRAWTETYTADGEPRKEARSPCLVQGVSESASEAACSISSATAAGWDR
jgi:hypothetical protein